MAMIIVEQKTYEELSKMQEILIKYGILKTDNVYIEDEDEGRFPPAMFNVLAFTDIRCIERLEKAMQEYADYCQQK